MSRDDTCALGDDDTTAVTLLAPPAEPSPPPPTPPSYAARALDVPMQPRSGTRRVARPVSGPPPLPPRLTPPPLPSPQRQPAPATPATPGLFWYSEWPAAKVSLPPPASSPSPRSPASMQPYHREVLALVFGSALITFTVGVLIGCLLRSFG